MQGWVLVGVAELDVLEAVMFPLALVVRVPPTICVSGWEVDELEVMDAVPLDADTVEDAVPDTNGLLWSSGRVTVGTAESVVISLSDPVRVLISCEDSDFCARVRLRLPNHRKWRSILRCVVAGVGDALLGIDFVWS